MPSNTTNFRILSTDSLRSLRERLLAFEALLRWDHPTVDNSHPKNLSRSRKKLVSSASWVGGTCARRAGR